MNAPSWIPREKNRSLSSSIPSNQDANSVSNFAQEMSVVKPGQRNNTLNKLAFELGRQEILSGTVCQQNREALANAANAAGLSTKEVDTTMKSGLRSARTKTQSPLLTPELSGTGFTLKATPYEWKEGKDIPPREWLYGKNIIRKFVSVTVAPGGVGKSALTMTEAIHMASGRLSENWPKIEKPLRVWIFNLEDPLEELQRRISGISTKYNISEEELDGRLFVDSGRDTPFFIAETQRNGTVINKPVVERFIEEISAKEIDVVIIDPFVSSHCVNENDNNAIDAVVKSWAEIADKGNAGVLLVHHTRKSGDEQVTVENGRGAKALIDGVREARLLYPMSEKQGIDYGVDHTSCFWARSDKQNMAARSEDRTWYQMQGVEIGNGDMVGVPDIIQLTKSFLKPTTEQFKKILMAASTGKFRKDPQAANWFGKKVEEICNLDCGINLKDRGRSSSQKRDRKLVVDFIETLLKSGALEIAIRKENSKNKEYITAPIEECD